LGSTAFGSDIVFLTSIESGCKGPTARWTWSIASAGFKICLFSVFTEGGLADWSLLTIFLAGSGALCSHVES
jgi:hypothetical protein